MKICPSCHLEWGKCKCEGKTVGGMVDKLKSSELKACPFCGGVPIIEYNWGARWITTKCKDKCINRGASFAWLSCVEQWNTRTPDPDTQKVVDSAKWHVGKYHDVGCDCLMCEALSEIKEK